MRLHVPYGLAMWAEDGGGAVTEIKVVEATSMSWWPLCWLIDNIDGFKQLFGPDSEKIG
jgi:hypothetical protein